MQRKCMLSFRRGSGSLQTLHYTAFMGAETRFERWLLSLANEILTGAGDRRLACTPSTDMTS
jgi:hypothetical protein